MWEIFSSAYNIGKAVCNFSAHHEQQLSLHIGDIVLIRQHTKEWFLGCKIESRNGSTMPIKQQGIFPKSYVTLHSGCEDEEKRQIVNRCSSLLMECLTVMHDSVNVREDFIRMQMLVEEGVKCVQNLAAPSFLQKPKVSAVEVLTKIEYLHSSLRTMTDSCVERSRSATVPDDLIANYELCMEDDKQNKRHSEGPIENPDSHMAIYILLDETSSEPLNYNAAGVATSTGGICGRNAPDNLVGDIFLMERQSKPNGNACNRISLSCRIEKLNFSNTEFLFTDLHRIDASSTVYLIINVFRPVSNSYSSIPSLQPYGILCGEMFGPTSERKQSLADGIIHATHAVSSSQFVRFYEVGGGTSSLEEMHRIIICEDRKDVSTGRQLNIRLAQKLKCDFNQLRNDLKYSRCTFVRSRSMPHSVPPDYQRDELIVILDTFDLRESKQGPVNITQKKRIEVNMFLCDETGKRFDSHPWKLLLPLLSNLTGNIPSEPTWRSHTSCKCRAPTWKESFSIPLPTNMQKLNKFPPYIGFEARYLSQNQWKSCGIAYLSLRAHQSSFQMLADKRHLLSLTTTQVGPKEYTSKTSIPDSSGSLTVETKLCSMTFTNNGHVYNILHPARHFNEIPESLKNFCKPLQVSPVEIHKFLIRLLHSLLEICDTCWGDHVDVSNVTNSSKISLNAESRKDAFSCILRVLHCINQSGSEKQQRELQQYLDASGGDLKLSSLISRERRSACDIPVFLMNEMQISAWNDDQFMQRAIMQRTETFPVMRVLSNLMKLICKLQELTLNLWRLNPSEYSFYETTFTDAVKRFFKCPQEGLKKRADQADHINALLSCESSMLIYLKEFGTCIDTLYPVLPNEMFLEHLRCILQHTRIKQDILFTTITQNFLPLLIDSQTLFGGGFFEVGLPPLVWKCLKKAFSLNFVKVKKDKFASETYDMTERWCRYFRLFVRRLSQHWSKKLSQTKASETAQEDEPMEYDPVYESLLLSHNYKKEKRIVVENPEVTQINREKAIIIDKIRLLSEPRKGQISENDDEGNYESPPAGILRYLIRKLATAIELNTDTKRRLNRKSTLGSSNDELDIKLQMQFSACQSITNTLAVCLFTLIPHLDTPDLWMSILGVDKLEQNNLSDSMNHGSLSLYHCPFEECCLTCSTLRLVHVWDKVTELVSTCNLLCDWSPVVHFRTRRSDNSITSTATLTAGDKETTPGSQFSNTSLNRWNEFAQQLNKLMIQFFSHFYPQVLLPLFFRCDANQSLVHRCSVAVDSFLTREIVKKICQFLSSFYAQDHFLVPKNIELQNSLAEVTQLRLDTCHLMHNVWNGLGESKVHYICDILPRMLPMILPDVGEVRIQIVNILFEMLFLDYVTTKRLAIDCIDDIIREHVKLELVECLTTIMADELLRHASHTFPNKTEQEHFVNDVLEQITVLLEFHSCFNRKEAHMPIYMSLNHLMRFYKKIRREDLNERYLYILLDFYNQFPDLDTEIGKLHFKLAKKYEWREEPISLETLQLLPSSLNNVRDGTQADLKERLLEISLEYFEKWDYEMGWMVCGELQEHYKQTVKYAKLEEILRKQANLIKKIRDPTIQRRVHKYVLITFVNETPLPSYIECIEGLLPSNPTDPLPPNEYGQQQPRKLNLHSFIYRTLDHIGVIDQLQKAFPTFHVVHSLSDIKKHENCILLQGTIKPTPHIPDYMKGAFVSSRILSYYETNQTKQFVKEVHGASKNNATFNSCTEITIKTQRNFPGIFPIYPIVGCENIERDSLHVALSKIRESLNELRSFINDYHDEELPQGERTKKLKDAVHKYIIAPVQGGLRVYIEFRLTDENENEKDSRMMELIECLREMLTLLFEALRELKSLPAENRSVYVDELSKLSQEMKDHFSLNLEHLRFFELKLEVKNSKSEVVYTRQVDQDKQSMCSNHSHSTLPGNYPDDGFGMAALPQYGGLSRSQMFLDGSTTSLIAHSSTWELGPPPPRPKSPTKEALEARSLDVPPVLPRKPIVDLPSSRKAHLYRDVPRDSYGRPEGVFNFGSTQLNSQQSQRESVVAGEDVSEENVYNLYGTTTPLVRPALPPKKNSRRQME